MYTVRKQFSLQDIENENPFPNSFETDRLKFTGPVSKYNLGQFNKFISKGDAAHKMAKYNYLESGKHLKHNIDEYWSYMNDKWVDGEAAYYMIELLDSEEMEKFDFPFIGWGGVEFEWELGKAEIGIALHPEFWGREISGERAEAFIDLAFWYDNIQVVEVSPSPKNEESVSAVSKYMNKLGGERVGTIKNHNFVDGEGIKDAVLFQITESSFEDNIKV